MDEMPVLFFHGDRHTFVSMTADAEMVQASPGRELILKNPSGCWTRTRVHVFFPFFFFFLTATSGKNSFDAQDFPGCGGPTKFPLRGATAPLLLFLGTRVWRWRDNPISPSIPTSYYGVACRISIPSRRRRLSNGKSLLLDLESHVFEQAKSIVFTGRTPSSGTKPLFLPRDRLQLYSLGLGRAVTHVSTCWLRTPLEFPTTLTATCLSSSPKLMPENPPSQIRESAIFNPDDFCHPPRHPPAPGVIL